MIGWHVSVDDGTTVPIVIPLLALCAFSIVSAANIANDLRDIPQDRKVHPKRALAAGSISKMGSTIVLITFLIITLSSLLVSFIIDRNFLSFLIILLSFFSLMFYETIAKGKGLLGNVTIAYLTILPFLLGASVPGLSAKVILLCPMAFCINLSRELLKDIMDMEGDRGWRLSFPILHGIERTIRASDLAIALAMISSILPLFFWKVGIHYLVLVLCSDILFITASFFSKWRVGTSVLSIKLGMVLGLMGFIFL